MIQKTTILASKPSYNVFKNIVHYYSIYSCLKYIAYSQ